MYVQRRNVTTEGLHGQMFEKRQEVSVYYSRLIPDGPDYMWSCNQHNARDIIRANWMVMKNLNARETGISLSGLDGSFLAIGSAADTLRMWA
jgi:hypothetical protein